MNDETHHQVINLPFIDDETLTTIRTRSGFHIFMMWCHHQFKQFSYQQRKEKLLHHHIHNIEDYEQHEASPRRHREPRYDYSVINKVGREIWNHSLSPLQKQAWKVRAAQLNALPPHGQVTTMPVIINNQSAIIHSINYSFHHFTKIYMHSLLKEDPRSHNEKRKPNYTRSFGNERVIMVSQIFCSYFLNHLLTLIFFGEWINHSFLPYEVIHTTKKTRLVHIGCKDRLKKMFEINGLSSFERVHKKQRMFVAGKAILKNGATSAEVVGYVVNEDVSTVSIRIDSNEEGGSEILKKAQILMTHLTHINGSKII